MRVQRRRPRRNAVAFNGDPVEPPAKPDHHRPDTAIPHDQVRPHPHRKDRDDGVKRGKKRRQVRLVRRLEQPVGRSPHAQPCQVGQGPVRGKRAARGGKAGHSRLVPGLDRFAQATTAPSATARPCQHQADQRACNGWAGKGHR